MSYPVENIRGLASMAVEYSKLAHEYGAKDVAAVVAELEGTLQETILKLQQLPIDEDSKRREPDDLPGILDLRTDGPRRQWSRFDSEIYKDKLEGALLARFAGCTLGAPVELWSVKDMKEWAEYIGDPFPPTAYWSQVKNPNQLRYGKSPCQAYTASGMNGVPVDDDVTYTILGLLIAEKYGTDFTTEDVGRAWLEYLPYACTAEEAALQNLKAGISSDEAARNNNPYVEWIGADIRSDPWAYLAPAFPAKAAEYAYRDAFISHRRTGIYGEMFFSAAQSAAFAVDNAVDALRIGLTEIPSSSRLYKEVAWALEAGKDIRSYKDARDAVDERFKGMDPVHTINNACLTVFGLMLGGNDVTKVISEIVAMGLDNDCTAATAGSIVGAIVGKQGIPAHWYDPFHGKVLTYLNGHEELLISDLVERFTALAARIHQE